MCANTSLRYTILIMGPVYGTQQSYLAYQFVSELLKTPHTIKQIFFYADGTSNASNLVRPANDEFNLLEAWQNLSQKFNLPLDVCVSAGLRRGLTQEEGADNVASKFHLSGLTALSEAIASSDRVIQF